MTEQNRFVLARRFTGLTPRLLQRVLNASSASWLRTVVTAALSMSVRHRHPVRRRLTAALGITALSDRPDRGDATRTLALPSLTATKAAAGAYALHRIHVERKSLDPAFHDCPGTWHERLPFRQRQLAAPHPSPPSSHRHAHARSFPTRPDRSRWNLVGGRFEGPAASRSLASRSPSQP